jgi:hypothetical protein
MNTDRFSLKRTLNETQDNVFLPSEGRSSPSLSDVKACFNSGTTLDLNITFKTECKLFPNKHQRKND